MILMREYFESLVSVLKHLKEKGVTELEIKNHPDLPEYFGKRSKNWIEGGETHTHWLDNLIINWFSQI